MKYLNTKPGSIEELAANMAKHQNESGYQDMFKKELEKAGKGIGSMTPAEKKAFFNKVDSKYTAKDEATTHTMPDGTVMKGAKHKEEEKHKEVVKEEDAYDNDRFIIKNGKATVDNSNTADKKDHVHAPNAKTAVAMYKAGVKSYKDTTDMRKKFPMAVEEVINEKKTFKEVYKKTKKEAMNTTGDATVDNANQNLEPTEKPENDPDVKVAKKKTDVGSKTTGVDTSPEIAYKN